MPEAHPPFVIVVWDDAWSDSRELTTIKDAPQKHRPTVMQTLGWLLVDDDEGVSVFNERCLDEGDEQYRGRTFIARRMIKSVTQFNLSRPRRKKVPDANRPESVAE